MRPGFFLREALRQLRRNAVPSFAAMATVVVTMLVLGVFIPLVQATTGEADSVSGKVLLDVYLKTGATHRDAQRVGALLRHHVSHVGSVHYVSKREAYAEQSQRNPEAYRLLGSNPLPDMFRVTPDQPGDLPAVRRELTRGGKLPDRAISSVKDRRNDTKRILTASRLVKLSTALVAALLIAASILLIANTIRLSLFARRREVEVMKLVGATDWFIRWPFILEGIVVGALGALGAIVLLGVGKVAVIDPLADDFALIAAPRTIAFPLLIAVLLVAGAAVSALGSGLSLRRFLRV